MSTHKKVLLFSKALEVSVYADEKGNLFGLHTGTALPKETDLSGFEVVRSPRAVEASEVVILKEAVMFNGVKINAGMYAVTKDTPADQIPRFSGVGHMGYAQFCSSLAEKVGYLIEHQDEELKPPKTVLREVEVGGAGLEEKALLAAIETYGTGTEVPLIVPPALEEVAYGDNLYLWKDGKVLKRQGREWVEKEKSYTCPKELTKGRMPVPPKLRKVDPEAVYQWQRITNKLADSGLNSKKESLFFERAKEGLTLQGLKDIVEGNEDLEAAVSEITKAGKTKKFKGLVLSGKERLKEYRKALQDIIESKRRMADIDKTRGNLKEEDSKDFNFEKEKKFLEKMVKSGAVEAIGLDGKDIVAVLGPVFLTARKKTFFMGRIRIRVHSTCPGGCRGFSAEQISYAKGYGTPHPHYTVLGSETVDCRQGCTADFGKVLEDARQMGSLGKFLTTLRVFFSNMHDEARYALPDAKYQVGANSDWNFITDGSNPEEIWAEKQKDEESPEGTPQPAQVA